MANKQHRYAEFNRYPKFQQMYINAFERMLIARKQKELPTTWQTGYDVFRWWMEENPDQYEIGEEYYESEE